jgi:hypothetical protein
MGYSVRLPASLTRRRLKVPQGRQWARTLDRLLERGFFHFVHFVTLAGVGEEQRTPSFLSANFGRSTFGDDPADFPVMQHVPAALLGMDWKRPVHRAGL